MNQAVLNEIEKCDRKNIELKEACSKLKDNEQIMIAELAKIDQMKSDNAEGRVMIAQRALKIESERQEIAELEVECKKVKSEIRVSQKSIEDNTVVLQAVEAQEKELAQQLKEASYLVRIAQVTLGIETNFSIFSLQKDLVQLSTPEAWELDDCFQKTVMKTDMFKKKKQAIDVHHNDSMELFSDLRIDGENRFFTRI
jgi:hypothetical protein